MNFLSDNLLVEVYVKALLLHFDDDFTLLLEEEINKRGINLKSVLSNDDLG